MPQQTSPFTETKWGWNYGEAGWNSGMDENLLKMGFMFDGNVDSIVASLPAAVNGNSYFLTTDNRFYFAVGSTFYSSPCPKHFVFKIKSSGDYYQFNGTSAFQIDNPSQVGGRLDSLEATIASLGSAAFEDVADLATQTELDVASAQANDYTDTLRSDLTNTADPAKGAGMVGISPPLPGSSARQARSKILDHYSVYDFSPNADGVTDDSPAFGLAARNIPAVMGMSGDKAGATRPETVKVYVPAGDYLISDWVDSGGRDVVWVLDQGAKIAGAEFLQGTIERQGQRIHKYTFSTMDPACGFSVKANNEYPEKGAEVTGISTDAALSLVKERASVASYVENRAPEVLATIATPVFTSGGMSFASAIDTRRLRIGMLIDTTHSPDKYSGAITGWSSDGLSVSVSGWYLSNGVLSSATTPPNGVGADALINPCTKVWGDNTNVFIYPESACNAAAGKELGVFNYRANWIPNAVGGSSGATGPTTWGYDAVNLGTYQSQAGFIQRGNFHYGLECQPVTAGLYVKGSSGKAVYSEGTATVQIQIRPDGGDVTYQVSSSGNVEAGSIGSATTVTYDFHSSGNSNDYDSRIQATGGSASAGAGLLSFIGGGFAFNAPVRPSTDSGTQLGTVTQNWSRAYVREIRPAANDSVKWLSGAGSPEGVVSGGVGSMYTRTDGGAGSTLYVKEAGSGTTGWVAK